MYSRSVCSLFAELFVIAGLIIVSPAHARVTVPDNPEHAWIAPLASKSLLIALDAYDSQVIAVGERGHVLRAGSDSPDQWIQAGSDTQALLTAVDMHDARYGWAVGHDAVILSTSDGGKSWRTQFKDIDEQRPLFDVRFRDARNGVAIGAYGYYLTTTDGGTSWQSRLIHDEHDYHLNAITSSKAGEMYIAAESGFVYRSEDNGISWQTLDPPYEGSFFDIVTIGNKVIVTGLRGHAYVSSDKGQQWRKLPTNVETALTAVTPLRGGKLLIVGHAGVVLLVNQAMDAVSLYRLSDRSAISDVVEINDNEVLLVGEHGASVLNLCKAFTQAGPGGCR